MIGRAAFFLHCLRTVILKCRCPVIITRNKPCLSLRKMSKCFNTLFILTIHTNICSISLKRDIILWSFNHFNSDFLWNMTFPVNKVHGFTGKKPAWLKAHILHAKILVLVRFWGWVGDLKVMSRITVMLQPKLILSSIKLYWIKLN